MIEVELPIKLQSPNRQCHWTTKWKKNNRQTQALKYLLQGKGTFCPLPVVVTIISIKPRIYDEDNFIASAKHIRDCIASHLLPGLASGQADGSKYIRWVYKQEKGAPKEYKLRIQIEPENEWIRRTNHEFLYLN